jgi:hypothetical protein
LEIKEENQCDPYDGKLFFNLVLLHCVAKVEKFFRFAHIPWATLDVQQPLSKSPSSYYDGTATKFAIAIPYHATLSRFNEGVWKEELIRCLCAWKPQ